ncbi:MAG: DegT/DnrJ/EryC1/StrS family aminotransferase, partial [Ignavibacteria bacterium]|nr:DegT/DnrJ/EryC1/StrS family aminotransferase [Ignavibacteria bacterium]
YRGYYSNYIFPVVLKNSDYRKRDRLREILAEKGIQTSVHYPPVHSFNTYRKKNIRLFRTEYYADNSITLPMYSKLKKSDINCICSIINNYGTY